MKNPKNVSVFLLSIVTLLTSPLASPLHSQPQPQNLIPNGDFEKGSQGFGLTAKNTTEVSANGFLLFKGLDGLNNAAQVLSANALRVQSGERMRLSLRTKREKMPSDAVVLIGGYYYSGDRKVNLGMENVFVFKSETQDWEKSEKVFLVPQKVGGETPVFFVFFVIASASKKTGAEVRVDDILLTREPSATQATKAGLEERMKDRFVSPESFRPSTSHGGFPSPIAEWNEEEKNFQRESARILSEIIAQAVQFAVMAMTKKLANSPSIRHDFWVGTWSASERCTNTTSRKPVSRF